MDYQGIIDEIRDKVQPELAKGQVATYIPELAHVSPTHFAMAVRTPAGDEYR